MGIGTIYTTTSALTVMNGNVGIGTWKPRGELDVEGTTSTFGNNVGIGTWVPSSTFTVMGSMAVKVLANQTSNYLATASDNIILVNANSGAVNITLPLAASVTGREYIIKKTDSNTSFAVTITPNGADTIDGQSSVSTTLQYQSYTVVSDGTNWDII